MAIPVFQISKNEWRNTNVPIDQSPEFTWDDSGTKYARAHSYIGTATFDDTAQPINLCTTQGGENPPPPPSPPPEGALYAAW